MKSTCTDLASFQKPQGLYTWFSHCFDFWKFQFENEISALFLVVENKVLVTPTMWSTSAHRQGPGMNEEQKIGFKKRAKHLFSWDPPLESTQLEKKSNFSSDSFSALRNSSVSLGIGAVEISLDKYSPIV